MVTGFFPFRGINETQLHENIISGIYPKPKDLSVELLDLLNQILNINPDKRISLEKILEHQWLNSNKNINLINKNSFLNLNLFTKAEKIIYGKLKLNYKKENRDIQLENFTNKNIDSYYEEENQNVQTMSFVFTPYNSNRDRDDDDDLYYDDIIIEDNILQFTPKIQEISRLYEMHNNYEFDQGYIIEKKELWRKRLKVSIKNSFEIDQEKNSIKNSNKKEISEMNYNLLKINISINKDNYTLDEDAIKFVESFGYKREYIIKSIESNELNHAAASYYLKLSLFILILIFNKLLFISEISFLLLFFILFFS
jgi:serine/threonine protein kinase